MENTKIKISKHLYQTKGSSQRDPLVILKNLDKSYGKKQLFEDVDFRVYAGDRIAIVGPNGIGKSTLLKILIGIEEPDSGSREISRNATIGFLPQETHWDTLSKTIIEEIYSANREAFDMIEKKKAFDIREKEGSMGADEIAEYFGLLERMKEKDVYRYQGLIEKLLVDFGFLPESWSRTIESLSGGERTKLALAKVLLFRPNVIVLDEPTNHLDLATVEWLENFLATLNAAIVCVAHDRYFLDKVCDKTYELKSDGMEKYYCAYSQYVVEKEARKEAAQRAYDQQQKFLKEQQEYIDRFRYKATKAAGVQSRIKELAKIEKLEDPHESEKTVNIKFPQPSRVCAKVLSLSSVTVGTADGPLFSIPERLDVYWGDKIGIIGSNGIGKSTLIKSIRSGEFLKGKVSINDKIKIGYYSQGHEDLDPSKSVLDEAVSKTDEVNEERIRRVLGALRFSGEGVYKKVSALSGGERARLVLAELIMQQVNLLLLDEPTNHLDLLSKEVVTDVFKEYRGTIILVSHDRYILNNVCTAIWSVGDGKLTTNVGNYDDYRYHVAHK
ncbi:MAG: ATP-binding cassette domain-containing protein [Candidatus Pacebacteria bacterium]|nr:ATP-binding cassette domain-containing protein [Candidatus Paceibacterota bacterium]